MHKHKNEIQSLKNNFQVTRDKLHKLENEAHILRDNNKYNIPDKVNNKIDLINKVDRTLFEINTKVTNKVKSIYEVLDELQDEIYNDTWLRQVELNKIEDILNDALNVVFKEIYGKNRISLKINIDKDKDLCVMDNDTLYLIDDKLDKIITQTRKKIKLHLKIMIILYLRKRI